MNDAVTSQIAMYGLATVRVTAIVAPIWSSALRVVPLPVMTALCLILAVVTAGSAPESLLWPANPVDQALLVARQIVIGATVGFGILFVFEAARAGAHLIGLQSGGALGSSAETGSDLPVLERCFGLLSAVVFFASEGHHWLIAGIQRSFRDLPFAGPVLPIEIAERLLAGAIGVWSMALQIALPAVAALLLADVLLAALARSAPLLAGLALSLQIRPAIAIGALIVALPAIGSSIGVMLRHGVGYAFSVVR